MKREAILLILLSGCECGELIYQNDILTLSLNNENSNLLEVGLTRKHDTCNNLDIQRIKDVFEIYSVDVSNREQNIETFDDQGQMEDQYNSNEFRFFSGKINSSSCSVCTLNFDCENAPYSLGITINGVGNTRDNPIILSATQNGQIILELGLAVGRPYIIEN